MRKWLIFMGICLVLSGCGRVETFETVDDDLLKPVMAEAGEIRLQLPDSASGQCILSSEAGKLYFCDGFTVTVQTLQRGDLSRTCSTLCGFSAEEVSMVQTFEKGFHRWDWVWTAAGEGGDAVGRAAVLDDGVYHYCVSVMAEAGEAGARETQWSALMGSIEVV